MRRGWRVNRLPRTLLAALLAGSMVTPLAADETRDAMRAIFGALAEVFPLSLSEGRFEAAATAPRVEGAFAVLLANVERLRAHGEGLPASYEFLRRTLANDVAQAALSYRQGQYESARFLVHDMVNACFGCHTRLPELERRFDMGSDLLGQPGIDDLPLDERARLATAVRQFERAMELYEALFLSTETSPSDIAYTGAFENYLKVAVRVRGDFARAASAFRRFLGRDDVPRYLAIHVQSWIDALESLRTAERPEDDFEAGREVFREAQMLSLFPEDPRALVHFVDASRLLHRFVQAHAESPPADAIERRRVGEAYYLLGVAEAHITSNYWYAETEFFLESAIRLAPGTDFARKAYAWLEEDVLIGYSGSAGLDVPADVSEYLRELRELIDGEAATSQ